MPEVADSAALLFDPHCVDDILLSMRDLLLNPELRARMETIGRAAGADVQLGEKRLQDARPVL